MECVSRANSALLFKHANPYIMDKGLHRETDYPYFDHYIRPCMCSLNQGFLKIGISGWEYLEEDEVTDALNLEPVTASIDVYPSLLTHQGMDVWYPRPVELPILVPGSDKIQRHALLLTGYGVDAFGIPYFIGKGAWTVDSWMNGYIRVRRDFVKFAVKIRGQVQMLKLMST
ncbi:hypothetical protein A4A49_53070 [Nicotiana attenuata]|uniref:Peptidase C1A papain C-terminal domain-containing protein n=1 Tax=Nicotiana attenuata TaxID=49451 RepID=A0A1J6I9Q5_NICAT|nr:hypothetical protein A4A49_53070 [Nicotiana attenuata]